jgi:hypothetical protein
MGALKFPAHAALTSRLADSKLSLTMNTYSHVMPAAMSDAAERMNSVLTG